MKRSIFNLPGPILLLLGTAFAQNLPYTPTQIFLSPQDVRIAYILQPVSVDSSQFSLSSLDLSRSLNPSNLSLQTLFPSLPFLGDGSTVPWNAVMDSGGNITVYSGTCGSSGQTWKLSTEAKEAGFGDWLQETISQTEGAGTGPQYLSSTIAFSSNASTAADDTEYYYFGGMCPYAGTSPSNWQANGAYSKNMVTLTPPLEAGGMQYESTFATTRNLPIAQAGQSLTALQPTYSNHSDDSQTRQQDFVLLGGHTQAAFINMSQVALWSLPQKAWTYFPVAEGDTGTRTDLAVRQAEVQIEPRSGHTATLSSDGTKIVVLGGWVGDVNSPAQPQVAILNVAGDYGGSGEWSWTVPDVEIENGLSIGSGIYGHGAVMLPGDIMLVSGGYQIAGASSRVKRALSSRLYLLNITSGSWLSSYSIPREQHQSQPENSGPLSQASQKAGLGVGLGFGAVAIVALISFYMWYTRRNRRLREGREKEIQELEYNPNPAHMSEWAMPAAINHQYAAVSPIDMTGDREMAAQHAQAGWRSTPSHAERTGLLVELPSPTRGLRRNASGKGQYSFEKRRSRNMEVIEEQTDKESVRTSADDSELQRRTAALLEESPDFDPFTDNSKPLRNHPVYTSQSPENRQSTSERNQEIQGWVHDWEKAADALIHAPEMSGGRSSPSKSDRTTSMLSESSVQSSWSSRSGAPGPSGIVRTLSTRSAALLSNFAATLTGNGTGQAPAGDARASLPSQQRRRGYSFTTSGAPSSPTRTRPDTASSVVRNDADSYSTAKTSFAQLQAEGEALLGGSRSRGISEPSSPVREKKDYGWYGSVKRAFSGARTTSAAQVQGELSGSSSPQKPGSREGELLPPRRATSDASFLRSRRGAKDWKVEDDEEEEGELQRPSEPDGEMEEDWDVERAAEDRVVQLMFTVPRQRLRVVNADEGDARSLLSQDDRAR
jgi:hypothetical protein